MKISISILEAAGLSAEKIVRLLKLAESEQLLKQREQNRIRQRNHRSRNDVTRDQRDQRDSVTSPPLSSPSMVSPITPSLTPPLTPPLSLSIKSDWPKDFREQFWNAYPRKVGKGSAIRKLEAIRKNGEIAFNRLLTAIGQIDASDEKFIPYPTTWLNQGRYLDLLPASTADPARAGGWRPGLPTEAELRAKYADQGENGNAAAEGASVLEPGVGVHPEKPNGLGVDRCGKQRNGGMDELFPKQRMGAVCDQTNPAKETPPNSNAEQIPRVVRR